MAAVALAPLAAMPEVKDAKDAKDDDAPLLAAPPPPPLMIKMDLVPPSAQVDTYRMVAQQRHTQSQADSVGLSISTAMMTSPSSYLCGYFKGWRVRVMSTDESTRVQIKASLDALGWHTINLGRTPSGDDAHWIIVHKQDAEKANNYNRVCNGLLYAAILICIVAIVLLILLVPTAKH